jgi:hypothetical protein
LNVAAGRSRLIPERRRQPGWQGRSIINQSDYFFMGSAATDKTARQFAGLLKAARLNCW